MASFFVNRCLKPAIQFNFHLTFFRMKDGHACFKSGDVRVNEHPSMVAMHTLWVRQHNRIARNLAELNPHWNDEQIFQETRRIVGAQIQHITYKEFLPVVLGKEAMDRYDCLSKTISFVAA